MTPPIPSDRSPPPQGLLLLLATANFVIGMGAFVVVGLLPPIAQDYALAPSVAGWVMTLYALVYAAASPLMVALTGQTDRRDLLVAGLMLFGVGAAVAALAPSFPVLLAARAVMALGAGVVTPVAASIAAGLSAPEMRGRVLATVFGGLTLAQVIGVPAGAWLGFAVGWPAAFVAVAVLAAGAAVALARAVPRGITVPGASLGALARVLASGWRMVAVGFGVLFLGGIYCVYSFFGAMMITRLDLSGAGISMLLMVFGLGAVAGNALGGRMADRIGTGRTLAILCLAQGVTLPLVSGLTLPYAATALLVALWSVCGWSFMAAQQARLAALDPRNTSVMFALNASAVYLAASVGTLAGGWVLDATGGYAALGLAGTVFMALALASLAAVPRLRGA
ncbi:MAG: MFS transporter [Paracoccaceae bacterium]|nr:MAG: MFS transporter [Paracoccaceae bacterium]